MGLRKLICLLPTDETPDHDHGGAEEQMEQPGTSYDNAQAGHNFASSYRDYNNRKVKAEKMNCSSGNAQLFACFRAGAINLIVHPACELAFQRQGASTVQPVNSLSRAAFLDGPEEHDDGDDPTSPVVTCIGQVKKEKPSKTPPRTTTAPQLRSKPVEEPSRACKWKQILGARGGTVNPSQQQQTTTTVTDHESSIEFHIDLNRFSNSAQTTPTFGNNYMKFGRPDSNNNNNKEEPLSSNNLKAAGAWKSPPQAEVPGGVPLWQRRNGVCKPSALELKRRVLQRV